MVGKLIGIGVGPGDPDLLTIKAQNVLSEIPVICAPRSKENKSSIALNIVQNILDDRKTEYNTIEPVFPMTEDKEILNRCWNDAADMVMGYLNKGADVAFVTLGDPSIFSTFSYLEKIVLDNNFDVETIPGITSFTACASSKGVTLIEKDDIFVVVPKIDTRLKNILKEGDTFAIMKTSRHSDMLKELINNDPRDKTVFSVQNCTMPNEKIIDGFVDDKKYLSTTIVKFHK